MHFSGLNRINAWCVVSLSEVSIWKSCIQTFSFAPSTISWFISRNEWMYRILYAHVSKTIHKCLPGHRDTKQPTKQRHQTWIWIENFTSKPQFGCENFATETHGFTSNKTMFWACCQVLASIYLEKCNSASIQNLLNNLI